LNAIGPTRLLFQFVEQHLCVFQVSSVEALGEPAVSTSLATVEKIGPSSEASAASQSCSRRLTIGIRLGSFLTRRGPGRRAAGFLPRTVGESGLVTDAS
jgi:hypothetical protein